MANNDYWAQQSQQQNFVSGTSSNQNAIYYANNNYGNNNFNNNSYASNGNYENRNDSSNGNGSVIYQNAVPSNYYANQYNQSNANSITTQAYNPAPNEYYRPPEETQIAQGGYLAMGQRRPFQQRNARILEPRYPTYDHWADQAEQPWSLQILPDGLIYSSYLAGMKEPRLASMWVDDGNFDRVWDATLGGRMGLIRFGSRDSLLPEGFQIDLEGAVLLRMDIEHDRDMMADDFRAGVPITFGNKNWQFKTGYYHLSSHMGDEYMLRTGEPRINYYRDSLLFGLARRFYRDWRVYGEAAWAFYTGEETRPWEFQFGLEYSPIYPSHGLRGAPFLAVNAHLFQELNYSGYFCAQLGWQWRGKSNHLLRFGVQYLNGYDDQFEFHDRHTQKIGVGIWYDF